jgi:hypothetical protein
MMTEQQRAKRNLNPHKPAVVAMAMWGNRYAAQNGGSMDFWDKLSSSEQRICREIVERIAQAPEER